MNTSKSNGSNLVFKSVRLTLINDHHDKEYRVALLTTKKDSFAVQIQFGRRDSKLQVGYLDGAGKFSKQPVELASDVATKTFENRIAIKTREGYTQAGEGVNMATKPVAKVESDSSYVMEKDDPTVQSKFNKRAAAKPKAKAKASKPVAKVAKKKCPATRSSKQKPNHDRSKLIIKSKLTVDDVRHNAAVKAWKTRNAQAKSKSGKQRKAAR